jgi:hypothetical protein
MRDLTNEEIAVLRDDTCPACHWHGGLDPGPRGGSGRNISCPNCGARFNVFLPRWIVRAERIDD